jgi:hypothetical protein
MAEMEDSKLKILIKHMDETNMGVQTLVDQGVQNDTMNDLFMGSMFEMANDNRLLTKQTGFFQKQGMTKTDDYVLKLNALLEKWLPRSEEILEKLVVKLNIQHKELSKATSDGAQIQMSYIALVKKDTANNDAAAAEELKLKKKERAKDLENGKEDYMRQTSFEKRLARSFNYIGNQFSDMKKSFMSLSDGILGSLGKTFLITLAIVNLIAYFRPVASMIARFFKTTFGPEDVGFFSYIGQNITMFLTAGLLIARKSIFAALFGAKGFFGLFVQYVRLIGKALATSRFALVGKLFFGIFTRIYAIPLLIFSAIKGFFTGFETSMEEGNGVLYSIMMGFVGAIKGVVVMAYDLVIQPLIDMFVAIGGWIADTTSSFMKYLGFGENKAKSLTDNAITDYFGGGKAKGGPVKAGVNYIVGEEGPEMFRTGTPGTITPNGAGGTTIINNTSVTNASQSTRNDNSYVDISTVDAGGTVTGLG